MEAVKPLFNIGFSSLILSASLYNKIFEFL